MVTIRMATLADRARLTDFGRRTFHATFGAQNTAEDMRAYLDAAFNEAQQTAELTDPNRVTWFAELDDALVGYAQIHRGEPAPCVPERDSVELVRLYVDRAAQGRGVAQQLLRVAEEAAAMQARGIWLGVWENNARAIAFYTKSGFAVVGSHEFLLGTDRQTDHIMAKRFSARV
jgi:ribosomal protein S18 acetylase RimI-like enzyme